MARGCDTGNIVCPSGLSGIGSVENNFAMSQLLKTFVALDIIILFLEIDSLYVYIHTYILYACIHGKVITCKRLVGHF